MLIAFPVQKKIADKLNCRFKVTLFYNIRGWDVFDAQILENEPLFAHFFRLRQKKEAETGDMCLNQNFLRKLKIISDFV